MADKKDDVNTRPLTPKDKEPQTAGDNSKLQEGANLLREQSTTVGTFGDKTSSSGDKNVAGMHGRDGGVRMTTESNMPNNPAPEIEQQRKGEPEQGDETLTDEAKR